MRATVKKRIFESRDQRVEVGLESQLQAEEDERGEGGEGDAVKNISMCGSLKLHHTRRRTSGDEKETRQQDARTRDA